MATPIPPKKIRTLKTLTFEYTGMDNKNNRISGEISAPTLLRARMLLKEQGINVLKLKKKSGLHFIKLRGKITSEDITTFSRQMATMLGAGIPLVQGLTIVSEGSSSNAMADLVRKIKVDVESGSAFSIALKKHPQYFDGLYCSLVESGEQSGTSDTMLDRIATYKEKSDSLRRKVKKALYYPAAVIIIAMIVTAILLIKVVPTFKEMFKGYGAELPAFTLFVLNISDMVQAYGIYMLIGFIILGFLIVRLYRKRVGFRNFSQRIFLIIPIFGPILRKTIIARFARTLSTTTAAGVPLTDALTSVAKATNNIVYLTAIEKIREGLSIGQQLRASMKRTNVFPPMVVHMIGIGEESGALEDMLGKVAAIYEEEVDTAVDGLTTLLEPLIMVFLGIVVGGLVIAMYLPIFKMGSIV